MSSYSVDQWLRSPKSLGAYPEKPHIVITRYSVNATYISALTHKNLHSKIPSSSYDTRATYAYSGTRAQVHWSQTEQNLNTQLTIGLALL